MSLPPNDRKDLGRSRSCAKVTNFLRFELLFILQSFSLHSVREAKSVCYFLATCHRLAHVFLSKQALSRQGLLRTLMWSTAVDYKGKIEVTLAS